MTTSATQLRLKAQVLLAVATAATIDEVAVSTPLKIRARVTHLLRTSAEEDALAPFPKFNACEE